MVKKKAKKKRATKKREEEPIEKREVVIEDTPPASGCIFRMTETEREEQLRNENRELKDKIERLTRAMRTLLELYEGRSPY